MGAQLTLDKLLERAVDLFPGRELVTKLPDGNVHRYTYADASERINRLAHALDDLGLERGTALVSSQRTTTGTTNSTSGRRVRGGRSTCATCGCPTTTSSTRSTTPKTG